MDRRALILLSLLTLLVAPLAARDAEPPVEPAPLPEQFRGNMGGFFKAARAYLNAHGRSPRAARVAMELYMLGVTQDNARIKDEGRTLLMLYHTGTLPASYMIRTFEDADAFRAWYRDLLDQHIENASRPRELLGPLGLALGRFGPDLLDNNQFCALAAGLAAAGRHPQLYHAATEAMEKRQSDPALAKLVEIAAGEAPPSGKLLSLGRIESDSYVKPLLERLYAGQLGKEDLENPEVLAAVADLLVRLRKWEPARELLERLVRTDHARPRHRYWLAWSYFGQGEPVKAAERLETLAKEDEGPWARRAGDLLADVRAFDANRQKTVDALFDVIESAIDSAGAFEGALTRAGDEPVQVYLAMAPAREHFEALIRRSGKTVLAYRTGREQTRIYNPETEQIHQYPGRGAVPVVYLNITPKPGGGFGISTGFNMGASLGQIAKANKGLLESKYLATPAGLNELATFFARSKGYLPQPPKKTDAGTRYAWVATDPISGERSRVACLIADGKLAEVRVGDWTLDDIRYGPVGKTPLDPPDWPEGKTVVHERKDPMAFLRLMQPVMQLMGRGKSEADSPSE